MNLYNSISDKLAIHFDKKPHFVSFVFIILLISFIVQITVTLFLHLFVEFKDISSYFKIFAYILHYPFVIFLIIGVIGPVIETIIAQAIPIEIMKRFKLSNRNILIISGFIFSLLHFIRGFVVMIANIPTGILFAFSYLQYRRFSLKQSLGVVSLVHGLHNTVVFLLLFTAAYHYSTQVYEYELQVASDLGNLKKVQSILMDKNIDINGKNKNMGQTALMIASNNGYTEIVKELLDKGADINAVDDKNYTALIYSAMRGHEETTSLLIENGADLNIRTDYGFTALSGSRRENKKEIVDLLKKSGAIE